MKFKTFTLSISLIIASVASVFAQMPGDLDATFGTNGTSILNVPNSAIAGYQDVAVQDDQKIVAVGMVWDSQYVAEVYAVRYHTDGSIDTDFGVDGIFTYGLGFEALAYGVVINDEGKIILAGATTDYQKYEVLLLQLNTDGTLDTNFGDNGVVVQQLSPSDQYFEDFAYDVVLDANGNILISGSSFDDYETDALRRPYVARFTANGTLDTDFGVDGIATIPIVESSNSFDCLVVQPDGKILAAGYYSPQFLWWVMVVARFNEDGTIDTSFGDEGVVQQNIGSVDDEVFNMALSPEGNIVLAGFSATVDYEYRAVLVQLTPDGSIDTSFGTEGLVIEDEELFNEGSDIQIQANGNIVFGGTTGDGPPGDFDLVVWKYNTDGSRDTGFGSGGEARHPLDGMNAFLIGIALQADNKIVGVGNARDAQNNMDLMVVRLDNDIANGIVNLDRPDAPELSPNPISGSSQLTIKLSESISNNATLDFYSVTGKLMHSFKIENTVSENQILKVTTSSVLSNGVYLVCVSQNGITSNATKLVIID